MAVHPRLQTFFEGAHQELLGAYNRSVGAPNACAGSLREHGIRRALKHTLPAIANVYDGELIDAHGRQSGQLDGIVVHAGGPALAGSDTEPRIVFAESALVVLESKSDIAAHWDEVKRTWGKILGLRRSYDPAWRGTVQRHPADDAIPFMAIGYKGWESVDKLKEKVQELVEMFAHDAGSLAALPPVHVFQLDKPGFAAVLNRDGPQFVANLCEPWRVVALIWSITTMFAQRFTVTPLDFASYVKPE